MIKLVRLNPTWDILRKVGQSRLIGLTILVPVIGYMILFNDHLIHWFELSKSVFEGIPAVNAGDEK